MRSNIAAGLAVAGVLLVVLIFLTCTFTVHEREQAVITRLSAPIAVIVGDVEDSEFDALRERINRTVRRVDEDDSIPSAGTDIAVKRGPGLYFKMPFVDAVHKVPGTLLEADAVPSPLLLADKKTLRIDSYARWRIEDPLRFYVSVRTTRNARDRLDDIIYSATLEELGRSTLSEVIRTTNRFIDAPTQTEAERAEMEAVGVDPAELDDGFGELMGNPMRERIERGREDVMLAVTDKADATARDLGIRIVDVRIKRADLLDENLNAVFGRMEAERARISRGYRSDGRKQADIIEGKVDREVQVILAEAERDAERMRGEGDAEAVRIIAGAFGANSELYRFIRSLDIIRESTPENSELIVGLDSSLYHLLQTESSN